MKWKFQKKYIRTGVIALSVIILAILFNNMLENESRLKEWAEIANHTFFPIIVGSVMAYLLNPILKFFERAFFSPLGKALFKKNEAKQKKFSRGFGVLCTLIVFFVVVVGGLYLVVPQVYLSLSKIVSEAPGYYNTVTSWIESLAKEDSEISRYLLIALDHVYSQAINYLNESILPNMDKIVASITSGIVVGLKMILNVVLAVIISVYVMSEKETLISVGKKLTFSIFSLENANAVIRGVRYANQVFGGFINGKIIDSFIIGAICYVFMVFADFHYAVLISIIVGVTNVIPYFGPFIGAIPSALILLMMDFKQGIIFAVFVLILQQVDGNIIGPLILGDRLKISSMWILFAILIGGGFFGVPGMILGAPCFACIYAMAGTYCKSKLKEKNLPLQTAEYLNVIEISTDGNRIDEEQGCSQNPCDEGEKTEIKESAEMKENTEKK